MLHCQIWVSFVDLVPQGHSGMYPRQVAPSPAMLIKALNDAAASAHGVIAFSSVEDAHLAFINAPLAVTLGESTAEDYGVVLKNVLAAQGAADEEVIYSLHSQLSPADLKAAAARVLARQTSVTTETLVSSIRDELVSVSAVAPEEVEPVDLAEYPGLEGIKEELERNVLFPLENPDQAKKFGLTPKRGVLLHGQPGTGKTTVGRWLANRLKGKFLGFPSEYMIVYSRDDGKENGNYYIIAGYICMYIYIYWEAGVYFRI